MVEGIYNMPERFVDSYASLLLEELEAAQASNTPKIIVIDASHPDIFKKIPAFPWGVYSAEMDPKKVLTLRTDWQLELMLAARPVIINNLGTDMAAKRWKKIITEVEDPHGNVTYSVLIHALAPTNKKGVFWQQITRHVPDIESAWINFVTVNTPDRMAKLLD